MTETSHSMSGRLGAFVAGLEALPEAICERAATCLLYNVGVSYGMNDRKVWLHAADIALNVHGDSVAGGATLLASGRKSSLAGAAHANAVVFGAQGRADTIGTLHASNVMLSAVLALAEARSIGADDILPALVAGYEVGARVDRAYGEEAAKHGFRSTALFGSIAAAAACARLLRLDATRAASAIAQAASLTGGLLQPFSDGSEEPRYQPGYAAALGLNCAVAAEFGAIGAYRALDGAMGLVHTVTGRLARDGEVDHDLGSDWLIDEVTFKPFPVCYYAQTPVYAGVAAHAKLGGAAIRNVRIRLNPRAAGYAGLDFTGPFSTPVQVMMSGSFAVVNGLVTGESVTMPAVQSLGEDARIKAILGKTRLVSDPQVSLLSAVVEIETEDGRTIVHEQRMTEQDYCFDRQAVQQMVRDTISGLPDAVGAQARFDRFSERVDRIAAADVLELFAVS